MATCRIMAEDRSLPGGDPEPAVAKRQRVGTLPSVDGCFGHRLNPEVDKADSIPGLM